MCVCVIFNMCVCVRACVCVLGIVHRCVCIEMCVCVGAVEATTDQPDGKQVRGYRGRPGVTETGVYPRSPRRLV